MSTPKYPKLTAKQRKGLDSLDGPDDESVPSVRRTDKRNPVRTNPKDSGRKGGERRQEKLQDEIHLGPDVMIAALNLVATGRSKAARADIPDIGLALCRELSRTPGLFRFASHEDVVKDPVVWLPLIHAVETIQGAVGFMLLDRDPRSTSAKRYVDNFTDIMTAFALDFERQQPRTQRSLVAAANCRNALDLVRRFWTVPDTWLTRIGRCHIPECREYFLDHSSGRRRRYCDRHVRP